MGLFIKINFMEVIKLKKRKLFNNRILFLGILFSILSSRSITCVTLRTTGEVIC